MLLVWNPPSSCHWTECMTTALATSPDKILKASKWCPAMLTLLALMVLATLWPSWRWNHPWFALPMTTMTTYKHIYTHMWNTSFRKLYFKLLLKLVTRTVLHDTFEWFLGNVRWKLSTSQNAIVVYLELTCQYIPTKWVSLKKQKNKKQNKTKKTRTVFCFFF